MVTSKAIGTVSTVHQEFSALFATTLAPLLPGPDDVAPLPTPLPPIATASQGFSGRVGMQVDPPPPGSERKGGKQRISVKRRKTVPVQEDPMTEEELAEERAFYAAAASAQEAIARVYVQRRIPYELMLLPDEPQPAPEPPAARPSPPSQPAPSSAAPAKPPAPSRPKVPRINIHSKEPVPPQPPRTVLSASEASHRPFQSYTPDLIPQHPTPSITLPPAPYHPFPISLAQPIITISAFPNPPPDAIFNLCARHVLPHSQALANPIPTSVINSAWSSVVDIHNDLQKTSQSPPSLREFVLGATLARQLFVPDARSPQEQRAAAEEMQPKTTEKGGKGKERAMDCDDVQKVDGAKSAEKRAEVASPKEGVGLGLFPGPLSTNTVDEATRDAVFRMLGSGSSGAGRRKSVVSGLGLSRMGAKDGVSSPPLIMQQGSSRIGFQKSSSLAGPSTLATIPSPRLTSQPRLTGISSAPHTPAVATVPITRTPPTGSAPTMSRSHSSSSSSTPTHPTNITPNIHPLALVYATGSAQQRMVARQTAKKPPPGAAAASSPLLKSPATSTTPLVRPGSRARALSTSRTLPTRSSPLVGCVALAPDPKEGEEGSEEGEGGTKEKTSPVAPSSTPTPTPTIGVSSLPPQATRPTPSPLSATTTAADAAFSSESVPTLASLASSSSLQLELVVTSHPSPPLIAALASIAAPTASSSPSSPRSRKSSGNMSDSGTLIPAIYSQINTPLRPFSPTT